MQYHEVLRQGLISLLITSALLFVAKVAIAQILDKKQKDNIDYKPLGWYSSEEVKMVSSPKTRNLMISSNLFSLALWCSLGLVAVLSYLKTT
jgi:hypothetical protein